MALHESYTNRAHEQPRRSLPGGHRFSSPFAACNFVVNWDGEDTRELLDAIRYARSTGDRFIQDKLIEYILAIPLRHPRPSDVPAYSGAPVWAVDAHGHALVGMPGRESIVDAELLRRPDARSTTSSNSRLHGGAASGTGSNGSATSNAHLASMAMQASSHNRFSAQ